MVSSWFIGAEVGSPLIVGWLEEFEAYLAALSHSFPPRGWRKVVQKSVGAFWASSPNATQVWWHPLLQKRLGILPYFACHYSYNRRVLSNPDFAQMAASLPNYPADPCHQLAAAAYQKDEAAVARLISAESICVHKLNWRRTENDSRWPTFFSALREVTQAK